MLIWICKGPPGQTSPLKIWSHNRPVKTRQGDDWTSGGDLSIASILAFWGWVVLELPPSPDVPPFRIIKATGPVASWPLYERYSPSARRLTPPRSRRLTYQSSGNRSPSLIPSIRPSIHPSIHLSLRTHLHECMCMCMCVHLHAGVHVDHKSERYNRRHVSQRPTTIATIQPLRFEISGFLVRAWIGGWRSARHLSPCTYKVEELISTTR